MGNTTTVTAAKVAFYHPPIDGDSYSADTHPTSTALADYITRAQNYVNELGPDCSQNMHDEAVWEIISNYIIAFNKNYLGAGGESATGEKSGSFSWSPRRLLSAETRQLLLKTQHASKQRLKFKRSISF